MGKVLGDITLTLAVDDVCACIVSNGADFSASIPVIANTCSRIRCVSVHVVHLHFFCFFLAFEHNYGFLLGGTLIIPKWIINVYGSITIL